MLRTAFQRKSSSKFEQQAKEIEKRFHEVSARYDMVNQRIRAIISYFEKVKSSYANYSRRITGFDLSHFNRCLLQDGQAPVATGNPGSQNINIKNYCKFTKVVANEMARMEYFYHHNIINILEAEVSQREQYYLSQIELFSKLLAQQQNADQQYIKSRAAFESAVAEVKKLNEELNNLVKLGNKAKQASKTRNDLVIAIKNYRVCLRNREFEACHLNTAHECFVESSLTAIKKFIHDDEKKCNLYAVLSQFPQFLAAITSSGEFEQPQNNNQQQNNEEDNKTKNVNENSQSENEKSQNEQHEENDNEKENVKESEIENENESEDKHKEDNENEKMIDDISQEKGKEKKSKENKNSRKQNCRFPRWEDEFVEFVNATHIVRMSPKPIEFKTFSFSFEDPQFFVPICPLRKNMDFPLFIAKVKTSVNAQEFQITKLIEVNEGEKVYVYDNLQHKCVLVSKSVSGPKGYVPSDVLEMIDNENTAIVKAVQLLISEDYLRIEPGEIVSIVEEKDETLVICENNKGEKGLIRRDCLVF
ncbi:hypothetical protein TRFO_03155 [Tritrichomonas foetus]|uniref:SH3 domain-containing protein n=1 Tax=Tritrichomonas foetus TaxID=1144522 RepID=A0A1J4KX43_9EUKA|nr:hypothetical protein TRFO_03155 [Tritrichomonas foetus]|eukprot:OHT14125.1 hypothetical protein TRFO_03155 [Tritrichomonas foetus]